MTTVLLMIHLFVTIALIGVVLIQRSEGGGLGIGTAQGMGSFMTGRGTANLLTRATAILAILFFGLSLTLALLNRGTAGIGHSVLDTPPPSNSVPASGAPASPVPASPAPATPAPATAPAPATTPAPAPAAPAAPAGPSVPTQ